MENKWSNLTDDTGSVDPELYQFLLHNYLPIQSDPDSLLYNPTNQASTSKPVNPEPEPHFYTPFTNPTDLLNQASTSNPINPEPEPQSTSDQSLHMHWIAYRTNFEEHVKLSWEYISKMECDSSQTKRRKKYIKISDLAPPPKKNEGKIPRPVCTCTGVPRGCFHWEKGGWQSSCCNAKMSKYPLPKDPNHKGRRIRGRKISPKRFRKIFDDLKAEGYDFTKPIDLKNYWIDRYGEDE